MSFKVNNFMSITSRVEKSKSERLESVLSGWKGMCPTATVDIEDGDGHVGSGYDRPGTTCCLAYTHGGFV